MKDEEAKKIIAEVAKATMLEEEQVEAVATKVLAKMPKDAPKVGDEKAAKEEATKKAIEFINSLANRQKTVTTDSGWVMPSMISDQIIRDANEGSRLLELVMRPPMTESTLNFPTVGAIDGIAEVAEGGVKPKGQPVLGNVALVATTKAVIVPFSKQFLKQVKSIAGIEFFVALLAEAFQLKKEYDVVNAIVGASGAKNVVFSVAADNLADKLLDMQTALKRSARRNGVYVMNNSAIAAVRKLKDANGQYIYQAPGQGQPGLLWDKEVIEVENLKEYSETGAIAAFVNPKKVMLGEYGQLETFVSYEGTITIEGELTSLLENNLVAVRAEQDYDVKVGLAATNVAILTKAA